MNEIQLSRLDLNLLVTFEALMEARSVTMAANKLGKTPSAVSHALGRLREQLGDPLLVKVGGKMHPSPFALQLIEDVRPILRSIQRVVEPPHAFVPADSGRMFRLAVPTFSGLVSRVFERVNAEAPEVVLEWTRPSQRAYGQVSEGLIDIAMLGTGGLVPEGASVKTTRALPIRVFARSGHPAVQNWSLTTWRQWPHIQIGLGMSAPTTMEQRSAEQGMERKIGAIVPDFGAIAPLLSRTNFLANNFSISLIDHMALYRLRVLELPVKRAGDSMKFVWNTRLGNDPGLKWLIGIVTESFESMAKDAEERIGAMEIVPLQGA
jgi:DNA-binding transcriptional LysR family regulator